MNKEFFEAIPSNYTEIYVTTDRRNLGNFHSDFIGDFFGDNRQLDEIPYEAAEIRYENMTRKRYRDTILANSTVSYEDCMLRGETALVIQFYVEKQYRASVAGFDRKTECTDNPSAWVEADEKSGDIYEFFKPDWKYFETELKAEEYAEANTEWIGIRNHRCSGTAVITEEWCPADQRFNSADIVMPPKPKYTADELLISYVFGMYDLYFVDFLPYNDCHFMTGAQLEKLIRDNEHTDTYPEIYKDFEYLENNISEVEDYSQIAEEYSDILIDHWRGEITIILRNLSKPDTEPGCYFELCHLPLSKDDTPEKAWERYRKQMEDCFPWAPIAEKEYFIDKIENGIQTLVNDFQDKKRKAFNEAAHNYYIAHTEKTAEELKRDNYQESEWANGLTGEEWETADEAKFCGEEEASQILEAETEEFQQNFTAEFYSLWKNDPKLSYIDPDTDSPNPWGCPWLWVNDYNRNPEKFFEEMREDILEAAADEIAEAKAKEAAKEEN